MNSWVIQNKKELVHKQERPEKWKTGVHCFDWNYSTRYWRKDFP